MTKTWGTQSKHCDQYPSNNRETNNKQYTLTKQTKANFPTKSLYKHSLVAIYKQLGVVLFTKPIFGAMYVCTPLIMIRDMEWGSIEFYY